MRFYSQYHLFINLFITYFLRIHCHQRNRKKGPIYWRWTKSYFIAQSLHFYTIKWFWCCFIDTKLWSWIPQKMTEQEKWTERFQIQNSSILLIFFVHIWKNMPVTSHAYIVRSLVQWLTSRTVADVSYRGPSKMTYVYNDLRI